MVDISIIIPAYNEEKRIGVFLQKVIAYCQKSPKRHEIIVVNDGSTDSTVKAVDAFKSSFSSLNVLSLPENQGKGAAVKAGVLNASGKIRIFMDADGSYEPEEIGKNLHFFVEGYDCVVGSRFLKESVYSKEALPRRILRSFFRRVVESLLFKGIPDTQCGFKMFTDSAARQIFPRMRMSGYGLDLEFLYLAHKLGLQIKQTPVACVPKSGSKVNVLKDSSRLLADIFKIRRAHSGT